MTEKNIKKLMAMGVDKLNISIDSWDAEEHDAFRRYQGAHKKAFAAVKRAEDLGMGVGISMVVSKDSTQTSGFQKLVEWCIETETRLCFVLATPIGNWEGKKDEIIVTDGDRKTMLGYTRKYPFITRNCGVEGNNRKCPALHEMLAITAYGDVLPCDWMHVGMGNVRDQSLSSIIEKGKKVRYLNGNYNTCIVAEEHEFIDNVMGKAYETKSFPIDAEDVFEELTRRDHQTIVSPRLELERDSS